MSLENEGAVEAAGMAPATLTQSHKPGSPTRRMRQPYPAAGATSRLWCDLDLHIQALAHALGHDAEVLEDLEAAPNALPVLGANLRRQPHLELADAQSAPLVPHRGAIHADRQGLHVDARFPHAEQEGGGQTVCHRRRQHPCRVRASARSKGGMFVHDEVGDSWLLKVHREFIPAFEGEGEGKCVPLLYLSCLWLDCRHSILRQVSRLSVMSPLVSKDRMRRLVRILSFSIPSLSLH